jgi:hypothetical protein
MATTTTSVPLDAKTSEQIIAMYKAGEKLIAITKATGVPRASIYWVLRKEGITPDRIAKPSSESMTVIEVLDRLRTTERENGELRYREGQLVEQIQALHEEITELKRQLRDARKGRPRAAAS